jgi:hypothetical protein
MTQFHGPHILAWDNLHQSIEESPLRDLSIIQIGDDIGEIRFSPTVSEYRTAAETHIELGVHITNTSPSKYTIVVTFERMQMTLNFEYMDSRNAVLLIRKILTGEGDVDNIIIPNIRQSHHTPTTPPRLNRQPNASPETIVRPAARRP